MKVNGKITSFLEQGGAEKTKIVHGNVTGVEFLGFHFNGMWKEPRDKAVKKFKAEIKQRTKRQQPISLGTLIKLLNPKIRGWRNYFQGCNKKLRLKELDEYYFPNPDNC